MMSYKLFICIFVAVLSISSCINAARPNPPNNLLVSKTIVVDPSGKSGFKTIQAAINSVPSNNKRWIQININPGVYREKVVVPKNKPYIYLKGAGNGSTVIERGDHENISTSPTFFSQADNMIARGIKFVNSFNSPPKTNRNPIRQAVAARIRGDKSAFFNCEFLGLQDTLWDDKGRHYFKSCTIEGAIDFIFGDGQSIYDNCKISVAAGALHGTPGYITAQGRDKPTDPSGFVFKNCKIVGTGKAYLGRPWRAFARTVFYGTEMSAVVVPRGWDAWNSVGKENQLTLGEYNSRGQGAGVARRVKWAKMFGQGEANQFASLSFIDGRGWVYQAIRIIS